MVNKPCYKHRSTKVDLNVSPGSYIDVSTNELSSEKLNIIQNNLGLFKRLGRILNVNNSNLDKNRVKIIVERETISLFFDQALDLKEQKQRLAYKTEDLSKKILQINIKFKNKNFLKKAPKNIIEKEKKALNDYKIELKKLNSILNSIRN